MENSNEIKLGKLFNPQSIAIVGASPKEGKVGNVITKNIMELGYEGRVYLVNPNHDEILGKRCYQSLSKIEEEIDLAIIIIPAKLVVDEIKKNAEKVKNFVIISAGFSEIGFEGKERENELANLAKKEKINILGPNCLGFIIPSLKLNASFAGGMPEAGHISFISQSGALAVALMDMAKKENIKFSNIISIGNKMQLSESELLEFALQDEKTQVIGMYLESIKDGKRFMSIAQKVSKIKPIIILKAGKNAKTQKAISSHTGALAGDNEIISAVFKKAGILKANSLEEFLNLFNFISDTKKNFAKDVVVITNAGGVGVLTADAFNKKNIQLANLDEATKKELRSFLPVESSVENPIDILGDAKEDRYVKTLEVVNRLPQIGAIVCALTPQEQTPVEKIAREIINFKKNTDKLMATIFLGGTKIAKAVDELKKNGICNFNFPNQAIKTLNDYYQWSEYKEIKIKTSAQISNLKRQQKVREIIEKAKQQKRSALYFSEAKKIVEMYGIPTVKYAEVSSEDDYKEIKFSYKNSAFENPLQFPLVVKVDSDKVLHKTDKKGVALNIEDQKQLDETLKKMKASFPGEKFIIQPMVPSGMEIILGIKQDSSFGPVVVYGLGGIYTEVFRQVDYLVPPLNLSQIEDSLRQGKLNFLFQETRGQKKYNLEEMTQILLGVSFISTEIPEIKEFDINPLIMYNDRKAVAVDIKIII